jgi:hypothetical protein
MEDAKMGVEVTDMLDSARAMWATWGYSTYNLITGDLNIAQDDNDPVYAQLVIDEYCYELNYKPPLIDVQTGDFAWSAVGMCTLLRRAGLTEDVFPFEDAHHHFIRRAVKARKQGLDWVFWAYRHGEAAGQPQVGDLVAYARGDELTWKSAQKRFDLDDGYKAHTDLVVEVRPGEIDVIGANVENSVTLKTLPLDSNGHIAPQKFEDYWWFATLRYRGE